MQRVTVIGAGIAGSEAAWQLAERGIAVRLIEMRPLRQTPVHDSDRFAELVCSNSLKSIDTKTAAGALKRELARLGSVVLHAALAARVPAGSALAVDRGIFSRAITAQLSSHTNIEVVRGEVESLDGIIESKELCILATGPLTSASLAESIQGVLGKENLAFFDAAAPIISAEPLDRDRLFAQSRYSSDEKDYLNAAMDRETYEDFITQLIVAQRIVLKDFESHDLFQACQPLEEIARKGRDALRFGALKPVGLIDPRTDRRPWAAVQLRAENTDRTAYNLVGFQTNLTFAAQQQVFRMIPGLERAEFLRYGVMHRNTFINSPQLLDSSLSLSRIGLPTIRFAGQITGTEGYVEAIGSGLMAALGTYAQIKGLPEPVLPQQTLLGSLLRYATDPNTLDYQPMHVNYGIMMPLEQPIRSKQQRYLAYSQRARQALDDFIDDRPDLRFLPPYSLPLIQD
ncbi:MAG: methylenetetrahydrofolate--tRNA-(uracil(54)-C(5))-methyltransferase (FADH(2)-oxidizing) TrmFO [Coriobacteriaceae bacterium]|nr:methylenetetrahydrofolate--tRNA-(uracil(54)-C(5))-methyltransferase (FADH(2)-oxidizing) TrmFO [Coriobacteriaceae bacterium]